MRTNDAFQILCARHGKQYFSDFKWTQTLFVLAALDMHLSSPVLMELELSKNRFLQFRSEYVVADASSDSIAPWHRIAMWRG